MIIIVDDWMKTTIILLTILLLLPIGLSQSWSFVGNSTQANSHFGILEVDNRYIYFAPSGSSSYGWATIFYIDLNTFEWTHSSPQYKNWGGLPVQIAPSPYEDYIYGMYSTGTPTSLLNKYNIHNGNFVANTTPRCYVSISFNDNKIYAIGTGTGGECRTYDRHYIEELDLNMNQLRVETESTSLYGFWSIDADADYIYVFWDINSGSPEIRKYTRTPTFNLVDSNTHPLGTVNSRNTAYDDEYAYATNYTHVFRFSKADLSYEIFPTEFLGSGYLTHIAVDQNRVYTGYYGVASDDCRVYFSDSVTIYDRETGAFEIELTGVPGEYITIYDKPACDSAAQPFTCGDVGLRTDDVLAFFASVPEFTMSMIICIQPAFIIIFAMGIASVLVLIFKVLRDKSR